MSIFNQFKTSKIAEEEGILIKFAANEDGSIPTFKIGRQCRSNTKWAKTFEAKVRPYKDEIADKTIETEVAEKINIEVFCSAIVLGWENIKDENGKDIEYSLDNAVKLMTDLPDLYDVLNTKSLTMENFLSTKIKSDVKN